MMGLTLRIKSTDFSKFAGYYHTDNTYEQNNDWLNGYIRLYLTRDDIDYFQVECEHNVPMHTIAYICDRVGHKHFIKTEFDQGNIKDKKYWLCFYKEDEKKVDENECK
jgi:hypothetical protein